MKRLLLALAFLCFFPAAAFGQTTVVGTKVVDNTGALLASGQWCFGTSCFTVTNGSFSGSVTPGTQTITVTNGGSTTYLTIPNISIAGSYFSFDSFVVPSNAFISGIGVPRIACTVGATYTQTDGAGNGWHCEGVNGQGQWNGLPSPGTPNSIAVGTTTTLPPGQPAQVVNAGTSSAPVLNFAIPQGAAGPTGPPATFLGAWSSSTAYTTGQAVFYGGSSWVALVNNTGVTPVAGATWALLAPQGAAGGITTLNGLTGAATLSGPGVTCTSLNCVVATGVPTLSNAGQAPVYSPSGVVAGNPTAAAVTPDALAQPTTSFSTQATPIASVTDTNAKTALTAINAALLNLQQACQNAGICLPNSLAATIASTPNAAFFLFNPTGSSTGPSTVTNQLSTSYTLTQTVSASSGAPNFNPAGKGFGHPGWVATGYCSSGPATTPSGAALPIGATAAACGTTITSTSQITSGASSISNAIYPIYKAGSTANLTLYGTGGGTVCWWGSMHSLWNTSGTNTAAIFDPAFQKQNEWEVGPGFAGIYNGSSYTTYTFPNSSDSVAAFVVSNGTADYRLSPENYYQMCMIYNGSTSVTLYMNDGSTSQQVATFTVTALTATSAGYAQTVGAGDSFYHEALLYLPGVQLNQAQVSGLYGGFNSANNHQQFAVGQNQGPAFQSAPENQWNTHTIQASDTQDCPYFVQRSNGGNSKAGYYNQTYSQCHVVFTTTAPIVRVGFDPGALQANPFYVNASIRVDGVLQNYIYQQSGANTIYIEANPATTGTSHTYDVNIGEVTGDSGSTYGNTSPFYTPTGLTDALGSIFLKNISVPNPYTVSIVPESGTVTAAVIDSIWSGLYVNPSSSDSIIPIERYNGGSVNNFNTANLAGLGYGSALLSTDFNTYPTATTTGSVPTTAASTWVTNYVAPLAKGTATNIVNNVVQRTVNDFLHLGGVYGTTSNCLAIYAFSLKNELAAMTAYNSAIKHYVLSPINAENYAETTTDGCTGDSYTTVNALTVQEYSGGAWSGVAVSAGTTFSGASMLYVYRAIEADICASTTNCTYVELGPGAPSLTGGLAVPTLSTSAGQCYSTSNQCYGDGALHLNNFGHWLLARYLNAESWATSITIAPRR